MVVGVSVVNAFKGGDQNRPVGTQVSVGDARCESRAVSSESLHGVVVDLG